MLKQNPILNYVSLYYRQFKNPIRPDNIWV